MNDKTQKRIDCYFDKLTDYINKLPVPVKVRNYVWIESYSEFYDNLSPSECGKNNNGIKTIWQLQRFDEQFKKNIEKLRLRAVEKFTDELNRIEPSEALDIIEKQLHELKQKELLAEIGADSLNDWEIWCEKYLSYQLVHQQKRPTRKLPKQQKRTTYQWQGNAGKELPELYNLMIIQYKLIASETTIEQFTAIFTGQPTDNIKPIKWLNSNRLLAYFLDCAFSGQTWQSIAGNGKLFYNKTKCLTANDLSVAKKGYVDYGQPKDYEKIDLILKTIKKD